MALSPELQAMFDLRFFHDNGWQRQVCPTCKDAFWTLEEDRTLCGDSTCEEYQFLGNPLTRKPLGLPEMREAFLAYWEGRKVGKATAPKDFPKHSRVPRNPVVARWRDDIYLNIASIANYQPHTTSGQVPPPANPLVVSQPCIRLNDLSNIGRSGRHFSCFEMMGHHAFNDATRPAEDGWGEHYWTEECVAHGHRFLTDALGLDGSRITYKESVWSGGGNAGPCFEVFAGGLEVATLVFMCLEQDDEGSIDIKGEKYSPMPLRIIDTGWGLERLAWASTGTPTAYDTVFPEAIKKIRGLATVPIADDARSQKLVEMHARVQGVLNLDVGTKLDKLRAEVVARMAEHGIETTVEELVQVMEPIEAMYGLADHLRCLSFMVGDGIVPGNVKAGYLMRLMFRRAFRYADQLGIKTPLSQLLAWNMESMTKEFPEFASGVARAREMADLETQRFHDSLDRGIRLVERTLQKKKHLTVDDLVEFYDTHGLGPNTVAKTAAELDVHVEVPDTFDALIAERHNKDKKPKAKRLVPADVPATRRIFYEDGGQWQQDFQASVTWVGPVRDGLQAVVLDQTCFFHETGGQPGDQGHLSDQTIPGPPRPVVPGKAVKPAAFAVVSTAKDGDQVVHHVQVGDWPLRVGDQVYGRVDWGLRMDHTRSHTATHIMNQAVRRVLGDHSWQAGTQKYPDCARVDMSHFRRPKPEQLVDIEQLANAMVMQGRTVQPEWWKRHEAEAKWGLTLLQGGIPKGTDVRVVRIGPAPPGTPVYRFPNHRVEGFNEDDDEPVSFHVAPDEDFDVEYCGGTHCRTTAEVGPIKLYRTERIQDGIERFEYSAGLHGVQKWQAEESRLREAAEAFQVAPAEVPAAARRFFEEWKERGRLLEEVRKQLAELKAEAGAASAEEVDGVRIIVQTDLDAGAIQQTAAELVSMPKTVVLLAAPAGNQVRLLFGRSADIDVDMGAVLRDAAAVMGGRGGGKPDFAQGAGSDVTKLEACMDKARTLVADAL